MFLGNISKNFTIDNMKKIMIKGSVQVFCVDHNIDDPEDVLDIHAYLIEEA